MDNQTTTLINLKEEKEAIKNGASMNIFIDTNYIALEYLENDNIQSLYDKLKETDKFIGAEDI